MSRALVVGILAVAAVAACGKDSAAPQLAPNAPAGRVIEVSGKVGATRGGPARVLVVDVADCAARLAKLVGDSYLGCDNQVYADDVIEAAADGAVVIELFHNNARWSVDGSLKARVDESVAWGLAKQDTPTKIVEHATSAAGRNAERQGADTKSSTEKADETPVAAAAAAPVPPTAGSGAIEPGGKIAATPSERKRVPATSSRPDPKPSTKNVGKDAIDDILDPTASNKPTGASAPQRPPDLRSLVQQKHGALQRCLEGDVQVRVVVHVVKGTPTVTLTANPPPSDKLRDCVNAVIKSIAFSGIDGQFSMTLTK